MNNGQGVDDSYHDIYDIDICTTVWWIHVCKYNDLLKKVFDAILLEHWLLVDWLT